ncbi:MAG: serine/threonine-protein kinase [Kofleriaceae bacterium]
MSSAPDTETDSDEAYCPACNNSFSLDHEFCPNDGVKLVKLKSGPDMLIGRVFDNRYEIKSALGHGGMGTVYRAWQRSIDRDVAIKVIHPKLATVRAVAKRFLREARLSSRLGQANIVNVYDFGQSEDGILYLVMELLRGHTLSRELESQKPLPLRRIVTITQQICDGLDHAHSQGIIHRDLKPGNIVILDEPPGRDAIKLLDFGLAKSLIADQTSLVTQTDALLGTPLYMPPEQILGKPTDQRADLYSLGCILFQMASGRPPFVGDNINITLASHVQMPTPPLPLAVPPSLTSLITKLMEKDPANRIASAREVRAILKQIKGLASGEHPQVDSAPLVSLSMLQSSVAPMAPTTTNPNIAVPVSNLSSVPPNARRRWWLPLLALVAVAAIVFVILKTQAGRNGVAAAALDANGGPITPDVSAQAEAGVVDGAVADAEPDAGLPIDARRRAPPPDARSRPQPLRPDAGVRPVDANMLPMATPDARVAPIDAKPKLDIIRDAR